LSQARSPKSGWEQVRNAIAVGRLHEVFESNGGRAPRTVSPLCADAALAAGQPDAQETPEPTRQEAASPTSPGLGPPAPTPASPTTHQDQAPPTPRCTTRHETEHSTSHRPRQRRRSSSADSNESSVALDDLSITPFDNARMEDESPLQSPNTQPPHAPTSRNSNDDAADEATVN